MVEKADGLYKIGEVSRMSGVSVKTIRHYSDEGVLPPSGHTETGYRLYSEADLSRLETARTLRAAGFDLPTIKRLLFKEIWPQETTKLQLEAVEMQIKALKRRRALLESSLGNDGSTARPYPDRARALALLSAHEREAFVGRHLEEAVEGIPLDPGWKEWFWKGAVLDLPEELSDEQLDAWVELAELVSDEGFGEAVERQARPFWEAVDGADFDLAGWNEAGGEAMRGAILAVREGRSPRGEEEQRIVEQYLHACAGAMNRAADAELAGWMLSHYEATVDPRPERYWRLVGVLKGWPEMPPHGQAYRWLMEGLRWRLQAGRETG